MKKQMCLIAIESVLVLVLLAGLAACNSASITSIVNGGSSTKTTSHSTSSNAQDPTDSPSLDASPSVSSTPTNFSPRLPTPFTPSPLPPLNDGSDLLTATPKLYYLDLHYIQILQDNKVIEPVNGVYKLSYTPFVFRYVSHFNDTAYVNFSFTNAFQNSAREGLDPFLPCPHPFCEENEYFTDQHIIVIDENKYNFMHFCYPNEQEGWGSWMWDRCPVFGTENWMQSRVNEHDMRMFGLVTDNTFQSYPIAQLRDFGDKIYITAFTHIINRVSKTVVRSQQPDFDLIKIIIQFEG
jgi:hypothetical protein